MRFGRKNAGGMEGGFVCEGLGGGLSPLSKSLRSRGLPEPVLHLTSLNTLIATELHQKLKCLAERCVMTGGWGADMRLGMRARASYSTYSPPDIHYSTKFSTRIHFTCFIFNLIICSKTAN